MASNQRCGRSGAKAFFSSTENNILHDSNFGSLTSWEQVNTRVTINVSSLAGGGLLSFVLFACAFVSFSLELSIFTLLHQSTPHWCSRASIFVCVLRIRTRNGWAPITSAYIRCCQSDTCSAGQEKRISKPNKS